MSEHDAIARMKSGDIDGLEELVLRYQTRAVRAAYLICHDFPLSEDIVQAAFLRAYERIAQFDESRPFAPWFLRSVVNDAVKALQRRNRTISLDEGEEKRGRATQSPDQPCTTLADLAAVQVAEYYHLLEEQLDRLDANDVLSAALTDLPTEQRAAVVMRYYLGLTDAEISARLDCTPGTVRWRLHAARERLRRLLPPWAAPTRAVGEGEKPDALPVVPATSAAPTAPAAPAAPTTSAAPAVPATARSSCPPLEQGDI